MPAQARPPCSQRIIVHVEIPCVNEQECKALLESIAPDNRETPSWLAIREEYVEDVIRVEIVVPMEKGLSARTTIDEIIEYVYSLLKTIERIGGMETRRSPS